MSNGAVVDNDGTKNYVANGHAEVNTSGWATYADAAGTSPVDGTGGTPTITFTRSTTTPLSGSASFLFTKGASNLQGQGASYDFTIDTQDKAKVLQISFNYLVSSGTFVAGTSSASSDMTVWIYDVTNAVLIQPSTISLLSNSTSIADKFNATFQSAPNSTSYRLIFHTQSVSALAYTLQFDSIVVSPSTYTYATPVTDWQSYAPTIAGAGTPTSVAFFWRRVGDSIQVKGNFITGTPSAVTATFTLPSGISADSVKSAVNGDFQGTAMRAINATGSNRKRFVLQTHATTGNLVYFSNDDYTTAVQPGTGILGNAAWAGSETISLFLSDVPIQGWSSSVQTSDQTDTRVVAFSASGVGGAVTANVTNIPTTTTVKDTHGSWSGSAYTVSVAGDYIVNGLISGPTVSTLNWYLNTVSQNSIAVINSANYTPSFSSFFPSLKVGDVVSFRSDATQTLTLFRIAMSRISGPSAIAATESVNARYRISSNKTTSAQVDYDTKITDSHGAVTTGASWKFTAPIQGPYRVSVTTLVTVAVGDTLAIFKNGSQDVGLTTLNSTNVGNGSQTVFLNAGEYLDIRPGGTSTTFNSATSGSFNQISIERVK